MVTRGFTLVEILVTLAIIALMATLFIPRMSKLPALAQPALVKFLTEQQAEAARARKTISVELHGRILRASSGREFTLAEGQTLRSATKADRSYLGGLHVVTFFTDGSSTSGEWFLTSSDNAIVIRFSPFSARIGYAMARVSGEGG